MPPQTGMFPVPYPSSNKDTMNITYQHHNAVAGPSSRTHSMCLASLSFLLFFLGFFSKKLTLVEDIPMEDVKKETKKRKEISGKLGKEMNDRRDECVFPRVCLPLPCGQADIMSQWPTLQRNSLGSAAHGDAAIDAARDAAVV
jgi:hypothetical protein